jgi:hypothetical protein
LDNLCEVPWQWINETIHHLGGWWIMCDKHYAKVQNTLISMATYGICANHKVDASYNGSLL